MSNKLATLFPNARGRSSSNNTWNKSEFYNIENLILILCCRAMDAINYLKQTTSLKWTDNIIIALK